MMREIAPDAGPLTVLSRLRVLNNRLVARTDTRPLSVEVTAARRALQSKHDDWQELYDARISASGAVVFADDEEDTAVSRLARRVGVLVDGKRDDPRYMRLFATAPSKATEGVGDEEQARFVQHIIDTVTTDEDYLTLRDLLPELTAARQGVIVAQQGRQAALQREEALWNEVQIAEKAARDIYRDTHPKLELLFPGRSRLIESFYPSARKKKKAPSKAEGAERQDTAEGSGAEAPGKQASAA